MVNPREVFTLDQDRFPWSMFVQNINELSIKVVQPCWSWKPESSLVSFSDCSLRPVSRRRSDRAVGSLSTSFCSSGSVSSSSLVWSSASSFGAAFVVVALGRIVGHQLAQVSVQLLLARGLWVTGILGQKGGHHGSQPCLKVVPVGCETR